MRLKLLMGDVDSASKWVCGDSIPGDWSIADLPIAFHEFHQVLQARIMLAQERFQDVPGGQSNLQTFLFCLLPILIYYLSELQNQL